MMHEFLVRSDTRHTVAAQRAQRAPCVRVSGTMALDIHLYASSVLSPLSLRTEGREAKKTAAYIPAATSHRGAESARRGRSQKHNDLSKITCDPLYQNPRRRSKKAPAETCGVENHVWV